MADPRRWALALAAIEQRFSPEDVAPHDAREHRHKLRVMSPSIESRQQLVETVTRYGDGDAYDIAQAIVAAVRGAAAGFIDEASAWQLILRAARNAQRRYTSWSDFGDGYAFAFEQITDGRASATSDVAAMLGGPWAQLAWDVELDPLPLRQQFCLALGAPVIAQDGGDVTELGGTACDDARGAIDIAAASSAKLRERFAITTRAELIAWTKPLVGKRPATALDLSRVVAAIGWAVRADIMSEEDAWHVVLVAGKLAQLAYPSWDAFAADYQREWLAAGGPAEPTATHCAELLRTRWVALPWTIDLEVTLFDPTSQPRILRVVCSRCGAPRTRPSKTAYVYCDHCGELVDYDFARACEQPLQRPGPVYENLRTELAPELAAALAAEDRDRYRAIERRLFDVWVDACPTSVPIRVRDPEYRARYVAWLSEANTVVAFDAEARRLETAVQAATAKLGFVAIASSPTADNRTRVLPEPYRVMAEAVFAYEARRDAVLVAHGVYALHPDAASRELQRRIGNSLFVQGWLPFLDEADARALVERTGFVREYIALDPPAVRELACGTCGGPLEIVDGARRVVCEHCGRHVAVI